MGDILNELNQIEQSESLQCFPFRSGNWYKPKNTREIEIMNEYFNITLPESCVNNWIHIQKDRRGHASATWVCDCNVDMSLKHSHTIDIINNGTINFNL